MSNVIIKSGNWDGWAGRQGELRTLAEEYLAPVVPTDIILSCPHHELLPLKATEELEVMFWAGTPDSGQQGSGREENKLAWGHKVGCLDQPFTSSGKGISIITPEGVDIAEVFPEELSVYIHFDLTHSRITDTRPVIEKLFQEIGKVLADGIDEEALQRRRQEMNRKRIEELIVSTIQQRKNALMNDVENYKYSIDDYLKRLTDYYKKLDIVQAQLAGVSGSLEGLKEKMQKELDNLLNIHGIKGYRVEGNKLVLETETIYIEHNDLRYLIGDFDIFVDVASSGVKFTNKTNPRRSTWGGGCHHPHISNSGSPCWGNVSTTVAQLQTSHEWCALASVLVGYLESVNIADIAGKYIVNWDAYDSEGNLIKAGSNTDSPSSGDEEYCSICDCTLDEDYTYTCEHCGRVVCNDCQRYIEGDYEGAYCDHCLDDGVIQYCEVCGEYSHRDEFIECEQCGEKFCTYCLVDGRVPKHDNHVFCSDGCRDEWIDENEEDEEVEVTIDEEVATAEEPEDTRVVEAEPATLSCSHCGIGISESTTFTCERCAEQGCPGCIRPSTEGVYECPTCRGRR